MNIEELKCEDSSEFEIERYIEFYNSVKSNMSFPNWLGNFNVEKLKNVFSMGGECWVYSKDSEIICSVMFIPADEESLRLFGIFEQNVKFGECGPIMVNPKYVGNALQRQMLNKLDKFCKQNGYSYILTTIHPDNVISINNFVKCGYEYKSTFNLKRGERDLYLKNL